MKKAEILVSDPSYDLLTVLFFIFTDSVWKIHFGSKNTKI